MNTCKGYGKWENKCRRESGRFCAQQLCDDCKTRRKRDLLFKLSKFNKENSK